MFAPRHFGVRPLHALRECGVELAVLDQEGLEEVGASVEQASQAMLRADWLGTLDWKAEQVALSMPWELRVRNSVP